ncbi:histidine phosphatase family protein [Streptomyces sp. NPDC051219]|uniref:SixA phosphatase family protein n=1 Tax=Streptomyces sp. NPDC051219 TaxID=3155283 RepID=UPI0034242FF6
MNETGLMQANDSVRLIVVRHAKAARPDVPDVERPLAPRGRRDAPAVGRWLRDHACAPDMVFCSPSRRTRETWELALPHLGTAPQVVYDARVYHGDGDDLLEVVREAPQSCRTVLLVGHRPAVQELVLELAREEDNPHLGAVRDKFPTAGVAVLKAPGTWAGLAPGRATLAHFAAPRGVKGPRTN